MKSLDDLFEDYETACQLPTKPTHLRKLPRGHIEDEEKSVKWNREFVAENNQGYVSAVSELNRVRSLEMNKARAEIVKYIQKDADVSEKGAKAIFETACEEGRSSGLYMVQAWVEKLIEIVELCKE